MFIVYRYMIGDKWIYVGKTKNSLRQRLSDHARDNRFDPYKEAKISYCELDSETDMDILELMLIKTVKPVINWNDTTDDEFPFEFKESSSLNWKDIADYNQQAKQTSRGRPIIGDEKLEETLKIRMGPNMIMELKDASSKMGVSVAMFIRYAIEFYNKCIKFGFTPLDDADKVC